MGYGTWYEIGGSCERDIFGGGENLIAEVGNKVTWMIYCSERNNKRDCSAKSIITINVVRTLF